MQTAVLSQSGREGVEPTGLAERMARGDPAALDLLIDLYQPRVTRLAHRLLGWSGDVDDVVQDVFLAALRNARAFRHDASLWTWLSAITINRCRSQHRRRALLSRLLGLVGREKTCQAAADEPALRDETTREVRSAVTALRPRDREVVVLFYLEQLTIGQISERLGASPNSVEVRLYRTRRKLRESLKRFMKD